VSEEFENGAEEVRAEPAVGDLHSRGLLGWSDRELRSMVSVTASIRSSTSRTSWFGCPPIPPIGLANSCPTPGSPRILTRDAGWLRNGSQSHSKTFIAGPISNGHGVSVLLLSHTTRNAARGVAAGQGLRGFGDIHAFGDRCDLVNHWVSSEFALGSGFSWCVSALSCA
jgi:hypothetical protein